MLDTYNLHSLVSYLRFLYTAPKSYLRFLYTAPKSCLRFLYTAACPTRGFFTQPRVLPEVCFHIPKSSLRFLYTTACPTWGLFPHPQILPEVSLHSHVSYPRFLSTSLNPTWGVFPQPRIYLPLQILLKGDLLVKTASGWEGVAVSVVGQLRRWHGAVHQVRVGRVVHQTSTVRLGHDILEGVNVLA